MYGHCIKCNTIRQIENPMLIISKPGMTESYRGTCPVCSSPIYVSPKVSGADVEVPDNQKSTIKHISI
jgi:hypothetical protein